MPTLRITPPFVVCHLWCAIRIIEQRGQHQNLRRILELFPQELNLNKTVLKDYIHQAIKDNLIEYVNLTNRKIRIPILSSPESQNICTENLSDYYCYECHRGGDVIQCINCIRVFHSECMQKVDKSTPTITQATEPVENTQILITNVQESVIFPELTISSNNISFSHDNCFQMDNKDNALNVTDIQQLESETDIKDVKLITDDVIFTGDLRPPNKRYLQSLLIKSESSYNQNNNIGDPNKNNDSLKHYCSNCLLKETFNNINPPFMSINETNDLLNFVLNRIRGWINDNVYSPISLENNRKWLTKEDLELFKSKCIKIPKTIIDLKRKIDNKEYLLLEEFHCDILDVRHCVGILHGVSSTEYEAVQYLLRDTIFELSEIRQCKDCYRHSHDRKDTIWFSKPCSLRHELVFAKQTGFHYWPAKVIKVINNDYDVRFFGSKHSRALVNATLVKPIDTKLNQLEIKKTYGFLKAMKELEKHQELLALPHGIFSYDSEKNYDALYSKATPLKEKKSKLINNVQMDLCHSDIITNDKQSPLNLNRISYGISKRKTPIKMKAAKKNKIIEEIITSESDENDDYIIEYNIFNNQDYELKKDQENLKKVLEYQNTNNKNSNTKLLYKETIASVSSLSSKTKQFQLTSEKSMETLKRKLDCLNNINDVKNIAIQLQTEINFNKIKIAQIMEEHENLLKDVNKKRWCSNCEHENM